MDITTHDGHAWPIVPHISSRLARLGALDRDAQQPFGYAAERRRKQVDRTVAPWAAVGGSWLQYWVRAREDTLERHWRDAQRLRYDNGMSSRSMRVV